MLVFFMQIGALWNQLSEWDFWYSKCFAKFCLIGVCWWSLAVCNKEIIGAISPSIFIFFIVAFLNTSKLLLIFNFWEEESTMRFSCCFAQKYCPYLLSFFFGFLFYFHDVECMCIKRRDTYDQWIVAETCSILFLFVKICNSVFWSRFNWKPWFLFTLCIYTMLHRARFSLRNYFSISSRNHSYKEKAEYVWKKSKKKRIWGGLCENTHI